MTREEAHKYLEDVQRLITQWRHLFPEKLIEANGQAILALEQQEQKKGKWVKKKHLIPLPWDSSPLILENYDEETHSEWEEYWHCSKCDYEADRSMKPRFRYCPNCGAKMEEE